MKVLMLTSSYPIEGSPLGPFVRNVVRGLTWQGVEVGVLIYSTKRKFSSYSMDGATIYEYPYALFTSPSLHTHRGLIPSVKNSWLARLQVPGYLASTSYHLLRIVKGYDIIHAHWYLPSGFFACLLKPLHRKPVVTTAWGAEFHLPNNLLIRRMLSFVHNRSDAVVAVSKYMKDKAHEYGLNTQQMTVIPNCIDISHFSLPRKKSGKIIIGTARRLVPEKRVSDLLEAYAKLKSGGTELWILGDGPQRSRLERISKELGITQTTRFMGMVPPDDVPSYLSQIDIFVNPSVQEGMATANIEAMAAGCVVVATNGYGNDEVMTHGVDGLLYEGKNPAMLASLLSTLAADARKRMKISEKARKESTRFSFGHTARAYLLLYKANTALIERTLKKY
ncbi:TPA: glycosyltransferase family 4 protein, partial [Candidatus Woesearchaeota archaeon]|nr:glycosyltransferase family 4 protein [Candidatus Woesearchaeota archaeon]HII68798.1 glycosyltransferase family 4 protein [Candidatus Woesearchaeota archaeon]